MEHKQRALLIGATGLTGKYCLKGLLEDPYYQSVVVLGRRSCGLQHPKLKEHLINFNRLSEALDGIYANDVFSCLGTTIKKAGSKSSFQKVDYEIPFELARIMNEKKAEQFLTVSAMGANKNSFFFYNKVKGTLEEALKSLNFKGLHIFRPSLILGDREESRVGESIAIKIMKPLASIMVGPLKKYRPIHAETIANSMVRVAKEKHEGVHIYSSGQIQQMGT